MKHNICHKIVILMIQILISWQGWNKDELWYREKQKRSKEGSSDFTFSSRFSAIVSHSLNENQILNSESLQSIPSWCTVCPIFITRSLDNSAPSLYKCKHGEQQRLKLDKKSRLCNTVGIKYWTYENKTEQCWKYCGAPDLVSLWLQRGQISFELVHGCVCVGADRYLCIMMAGGLLLWWMLLIKLPSPIFVLMCVYCVCVHESKEPTFNRLKVRLCHFC